MVRSDANAIALRAIGEILDAAASFEFVVDGATIRVEVIRLPQPVWPTGVKQLDPAVAGPWPRPVRATASWDGGQFAFDVVASRWSGGAATPYAGLIGLAILHSTLRREIVWCTLGALVGTVADGGEASIRLWASLMARKQEDWTKDTAPLAARLKQLTASVLPVEGTSAVDAGRIVVPDGTLTPVAATIFRRLATLAVVKAPFVLRDRPEWRQGTAPFVLTGAPSAPEPPAPPPSEVSAGSKRLALNPLPGGVREYDVTLRRLLALLQDRAMADDELRETLVELYELDGQTAIDGYLTFLRTLGVVDEVDGMTALSDDGAAVLADPDPARVFGLLHERFAGVLDTLALCAHLPTRPALATDVLNQLLGRSWKSMNQASFRLNWLLSLGLTERLATGDRINASGQAVLARFEPESSESVERVRQVLAETPPEGPPPLDDGSTPEDEAEAPGVDVGARSPEGGEPSGWRSSRLDLRSEQLEAQLGSLRMPPGVVSQCVAALSSGKHLLLVGPPGTGKTQLAQAIAAAAAIEGYTHGILPSTASADWTTYETVGGYVLQKDQSLSFRSGVFLRAIETHRWLLVDELNRADVDRAFGELMTVIAGGSCDTPFVDDQGRVVRIAPDGAATHVVPPTFRVLATMNTWDKTSLFRLSFALQRRFAIVHVGLPDPATFTQLLRDVGQRPGHDPALDVETIDAIVGLFAEGGLRAVRQIGPAVPLDVVHYVRRRASPDGLAEAIAMLVLAQLEGLEVEEALRAWKVITAATTTASDDARAMLRERWRDLFPYADEPS